MQGAFLREWSTPKALTFHLFYDLPPLASFFQYDYLEIINRYNVVFHILFKYEPTNCFNVWRGMPTARRAEQQTLSMILIEYFNEETTQFF